MRIGRRKAIFSADPTDGRLDQPKVTIWNASLTGSAPVKLTEGDEPALSAKGVLAFIKDHQVWTVALDGKGKPERLFFDRGKDRSLRWSPDGSRLAFVSDRNDHAFVGVFVSKDKSLLYLAPSTNFSFAPRWSPDGTRIAFACLPGDGGAPEPLLKRVPRPWSLWIADAASGAAHRVWQSPDTLDGSYPDTEGETNLHWGAGSSGDRLVFLADLDGWPHLYSVTANGGAPLLLTPGAFMVEHVAESRDLKFMIYDANTNPSRAPSSKFDGDAGTAQGDVDRRHIFRVPVDAATPQQLTDGKSSIEWTPVAAANDRVAFVSTGPQEPPLVGIVGLNGQGRDLLEPANAIPRDFPLAELVIPTPVTFKAADGTIVHGQLFRLPRR